MSGLSAEFVVPAANAGELRRVRENTNDFPGTNDSRPSALRCAPTFGHGTSMSSTKRMVEPRPVILESRRCVHQQYSEIDVSNPTVIDRELE